MLLQVGLLIEKASAGMVIFIHGIVTHQLVVRVFMLTEKGLLVNSSGCFLFLGVIINYVSWLCDWTWLNRPPLSLGLWKWRPIACWNTWQHLCKIWLRHLERTMGKTSLLTTWFPFSHTVPGIIIYIVIYSFIQNIYIQGERERARERGGER